MSETTSSLPEVAIQAEELSEQPQPADANLADKRSGFVSRSARAVLHGIPTLLILGLLVGLAYWGHHYGWSLPKFSELIGNVKDTGELWCDEHGVAEADCISCNADLMPKAELAGWCDEHGVHECVLHNPNLAQLKETPEINQDDLDRAARAIAARPRTKNDPGCKMHLRRIQFPSIEAVDQAGIDINLVDRGQVIETIKTTGEIVYDPTRVAHLASRANGTILRVEKGVGDAVRKGDVLALVDAVEVGRLKSKLLMALSQLELDTTTLDRVKRLGGTVIPEKEIQEAAAAKSATEYELESAMQGLSNLGLPIQTDEIFGQPASVVRSKLRNLGLPKSMLGAVDTSRASANLVPILAPRDGVVVKRDAVAGEVIDTGKSLFTIADTSQMWLQLNVRLEEAERISLGQKILFTPDGSEKESVGTITWISTEVDGQTRTVRVRGELANEGGRLRNETFGAGEIVLRDVEDAILVPNEAIHWEGCCHVAFVRDKDYFKDGSYKVFHTRSVRPGAIMGDNTEVIAGLLPGEVVVTKGSGILRAELLKGNLGAG
jgi:cobalt-zinc-cadmium efflux system membrane fusion protein